MPSLSELTPRLQQALLLDWDSPELRGPQFVSPDGVARKKLTDLVSPRSDAAITWGVFRTLERFPAQGWLPHLLGAAGPSRWEPAEFTWWQAVPPRSRLLWLLDHLEALSFSDSRQQPAARARLARVAAGSERWKRQVDEGVARGDGILEPPFEADLVLSTPDVLVVVLGLYRRDIERHTLWDPRRDTLVRGLDAALELAGDREPWLLLVTDDYRHEGPDVRAAAYEGLAPRYRSDFEFLDLQFPHRPPTERARLAGHLRWLSWADLLDLVLDHSAGLSGEQRLTLRRLVDYLKGKRLLFKGG